MSKHRHTENIEILSPSERRAEIASILANGYRRMAKDRLILGKSAEIPADSRTTCLDCRGDSALMDPPVDGTGERRVERCP
jgi:hypothetical protein